MGKSCCNKCNEGKVSCTVNEAVEPKGNMAKIQKIVQDKQAARIGGVMVDGISAGLLMQVFDKVNDSNKEKLNKMNMKRLTNVIHKVWNKYGDKVKLSEAVYKFKKLTHSQMDELDAALSRAGIQGTPDFNKMTWTTSGKQSSSVISKIMKKAGGKKIKSEAKMSDKDLLKYALYIKKYKPDMWNHLKKHPDMKKMLQKFGAAG